jgi:hypothetical protein
MRPSLIVAGVLAASALVSAGGTAEARLVTTQVVRGRLLPTDDASDAMGKFRILVKDNGTAQREFLYVDAWGLDASRDGEGNLPSYRAWIVTADGGTSADFGEMYLSARGRAKLRFHSARDSFPSGVETLKDFAGGTVEVRLGDAVVLAGDVPDFLGLLDGNSRGSGAAAKAVGTTRLRPTEDGAGAKGVLQAVYANRPRVQVEALRIECLGLGSRGDEFTAVCVDGEGTGTTLGTMVSRTRYGVAVLHLSTRRGDTIPGGGVLALAGPTVEIRDASGTAWLTGTFPTLAE